MRLGGLEAGQLLGRRLGWRGAHEGHGADSGTGFRWRRKGNWRKRLRSGRGEREPARRHQRLELRDSLEEDDNARRIVEEPTVHL